MSITLKPEQEQFIQEKLKSGKYRTADEVLTEAFRLLEEQDKNLATQQAAVDLSRFIGAIQLTEDPVEFQQRLRNEW